MRRRCAARGALNAQARRAAPPYGDGYLWSEKAFYLHFLLLKVEATDRQKSGGRKSVEIEPGCCCLRYCGKPAKMAISRSGLCEPHLLAVLQVGFTALDLANNNKQKDPSGECVRLLQGEQWVRLVSHSVCPSLCRHAQRWGGVGCGWQPDGRIGEWWCAMCGPARRPPHLPMMALLFDD